MELSDIRVFLTLAEELHFARTAAKLGLSTGRVSQLISAVETELGGVLFDRTSRRVELTALGRELDRELRPALAGLDTAVATVRRAARIEPLRIRVTASLTTAGRAWTGLRRAAVARRPDLDIVLLELPYGPDSYRQLRDGSADALVYWKSPLPQDLVLGPVIDRQQRVAMVSASHPLAGEASIEMAQVRQWVGGGAWGPSEVVDVFLPRAGHSGAATMEVVDIELPFISNLIDTVAEGSLAHATVASIGALIHRSDIVLVPIRDLPPIELALIWPEHSRHPGLRALVDVARERETPAGA